jgi:hypothetical protein
MSSAQTLVRKQAPKKKITMRIRSKHAITRIPDLMKIIFDYLTYSDKLKVFTLFGCNKPEKPLITHFDIGVYEYEINDIFEKSGECMRSMAFNNDAEVESFILMLTEKADKYTSLTESKFMTSGEEIYWVPFTRIEIFQSQFEFFDRILRHSYKDISCIRRIYWQCPLCMKYNSYCKRGDNMFCQVLTEMMKPRLTGKALCMCLFGDMRRHVEVSYHKESFDRKRDYQCIHNIVNAYTKTCQIRDEIKRNIRRENNYYVSESEPESELF